MGRTIGIGLLVVILLAVAAVFVVPALIPASVYKAEIAKAVEKSTGRSFKIEGSLRLSIFPGVKAAIEQASLSNAPGGKAATMAEVGKLSVGLKLIPLLSRKFEVSSLVLEDAVIHLETAADGTPNWKFTPATDEAAGAGADKSSKVKELSLADMRIVNGLVTYDNAKTNAHHELSRITAKVSLPSLDSPFAVAGKATYKEQPLDLAATLGKARVLVDGGTTDLDVAVKGALIDASFDGTGTFGEKLSLEGDTKLDSPSARKLAGWLGKPISGGTGFGKLSVSGRAAFDGSRLNFDNAKLHLDAIDAGGNLAADFSGARPKITGALSASQLDLRPYTGGGKAAGTSGGTTTAGAGWSSEPIDASALRSFDADLDLAADQILLRDLKIDRSQAGVTVAGGVMTAILKQVGLYSGQAKGKLIVDGRQTPSTITSDMSLTGLDLAGFMHDAAKTDRFSGIGNFDVDLKGSGRSQRELVANLGGATKINFKNGAIKGIDLVRIANLVQTLIGKPQQTQAGEGQTSSTGQSADQPVGQAAGDSTKFVALGANFAVTNGVMRTSDFSMVNDLLSLSGGGAINLNDLTIDFRLTPGLNQKDGGLKVALKITGPLSHPKIVPDASGILRGELQKRLGDTPAGQLLDQLLGGGKSGQTQDGQPAQQPPSVKSLLEGFLGKKKPEQPSPAPAAPPAAPASPPAPAPTPETPAAAPAPQATEPPAASPAEPPPATQPAQSEPSPPAPPSEATPAAPPPPQ